MAEKNGRARAWTIGGVLAGVLALVSILAILGKPWRAYGRDEHRLVRCEEDIQNNTNEIRRVEREAREERAHLAEDIASVKRSCAAIEVRLASIETYQEETRQDIKEILRRLPK